MTTNFSWCSMAQMQMAALKEAFDNLWIVAGKIAVTFGARDSKTQTSVQTLKCMHDAGSLLEQGQAEEN